ncbi:septal ring lytic transglycosylase RlpA family protein [Marinobacter salinexigens]|uniref:Endolytic peptidoglycan transglycosylase RlpA n=1 Tax=Marinobacter salinexigens TaxID=2919747 RepID=A0A5B0VFE0_9GAMM|nr:septal ring lytic transglycosylase RlpA family protein [Marinobacter salinexigens]KAA1173360.1 septal ring lytic transglycosylase RlpA family protein [Marinobacter salinexigens]
MKYLTSWLLASFLVLGGCASSPEVDHSSRYTISQDRAPEGNFDASGLSDARPVYEAPRNAGNKSPYTVWGKSYHVLPSNDGYVARGTASWYGEKFHGHKTSNGEVFDMYAMSAAHKSLRIPGYARVTNLDNGRSVIVRVNDRGPFHSDRVIDLSYAAAKKLGYQARGTARVEVAAITVRPDGSMTLAGQPFQPGQPVTYSDTDVAASGDITGASQALYVQLGSFSSRDPAERLLTEARAVLENPMRVRSIDTASGRFHRVQVGPFEDEDSARRTQSLLEARGFSQSILLTDTH